MKGTRRQGTTGHFSEAAKAEGRRRIKSGEFRTYDEVCKAFGISKVTAARWTKAAGYRMGGLRELDDCSNKEDLLEDSQKTEALKEKWKGHPFVEPDPGVESFRTEKEALEYYRMRARYLENLYMLVDEPTEVKKKALRQLEERLREKLAKGGF